MRRVLVVGDVIEDVYRDCRFRKMCPDAPEVRALVHGSVESRPGGAANVAVNLAALAPDVTVDLIGAISSEMATAVKRLSGNRVSMEHAAIVGDDAGGYYALLRKERIFCDGQLVVRIDNRSRVTRYTREMVGRGMRSYLSHCSPELVVMADYDGGALYDEGRSDDGNLQVLLSMRDRLLVDTKLTDLSVFDGTLLAKLNEREWEAVIRTEATPERFFSFLVVTHGAAGAELIMRRSTGPKSSTTHSLRTKACPVEAVDVCGCGDTFLAGLAAMMLRNPDPFTALQFANAAASTVVSRPRTEIADRDMTLRIVGRTDEARG